MKVLPTVSKLLTNSQYIHSFTCIEMRIPVIGTVMKSYFQQLKLSTCSMPCRGVGIGALDLPLTTSSLVLVKLIDILFSEAPFLMESTSTGAQSQLVALQVLRVICVLDQQCSRIVPRSYVIYQYRKKNWTWIVRDVFFVPGRGLQVTFTQAMKTLNGSVFVNGCN